MLDPVEALLLGGGDEHAVDDERRRGVAVVRVQAEDRGHGPMLLIVLGGSPGERRCR